MLYSDVELSKISSILLDNQSRTSILLTQVLAKNFWNIAPEWVTAEDGFESQIKNTIAAVVIGDRTFALENFLPVNITRLHLRNCGVAPV